MVEQGLKNDVRIVGYSAKRVAEAVPSMVVRVYEREVRDRIASEVVGPSGSVHQERRGNPFRFLNTAIDMIVAGEETYTQRPEVYDDYVNTVWGREALSRDIAYVVTNYTQRGGRVLDIASGTGAVFNALNGSGFQVFNTDLSGPALHRMADRHTNSQVVAAVSNMNEGFPLASGIFDTAVTSCANRYINNIPVFLSETYRVLKPGGVFVLPIFAVDVPEWKAIRDEGNGSMIENSAAALAHAGFEIVDIDLQQAALRNKDAGVPFYTWPAYIIARKGNE